MRRSTSKRKQFKQKSPTLSNFGESKREASGKKKALKSSFSCTHFIKK